MPLRVEIPGVQVLELEHLLLDQNGTLTDRGDMIPGVAEQLQLLGQSLHVHILSADTFGTLDRFSRSLGLEGHRVGTGSEKLAFLEELGGDRCAAVGNGTNDIQMLEHSALGIVVIGPEGASAAAIAAADMVCASIGDAFRLLLEPITLAAGLRI